MSDKTIDEMTKVINRAAEKAYELTPEELDVESFLVRGTIVLERVLLDGAVGVSISDFIHDADRRTDSHADDRLFVKVFRLLIWPLRMLRFAMLWITWELWGRVQYRAAVTNGIAKWRAMAVEKNLKRWQEMAGLTQKPYIDENFLKHQRAVLASKPASVTEAAAIHAEIIRSTIVKEELPKPDVEPLQ